MSTSLIYNQIIYQSLKHVNRSVDLRIDSIFDTASKYEYSLLNEVLVLT